MATNSSLQYRKAPLDEMWKRNTEILRISPSNCDKSCCSDEVEESVLAKDDINFVRKTQIAYS